MTKISRAELAISRSLRALAIAQKVHRNSRRRTIAIDGEHSCGVPGRRDHNATHAITPHRLAPRSHSGVVA
jgi:hypothetical protein